MTLVRVCADTDCDTRLRATNTGSHCSTHERERLHLVPAVLVSQMLPQWVIGNDVPCRVYSESGYPAEKWFLDDYASGAPIPTVARGAMEVCAGCPFRRECLDHAFTVEDRNAEVAKDEGYGDVRYGVYGGVPGRERARIARVHESHAERVEAALAWATSFAVRHGWIEEEAMA